MSRLSLSRLHDTIRMSTRFLQMSPFYECFGDHDKLHGQYAGRMVYFGDEKAEEYWALREQAVLYDVPERPWEISGPDAAALMEYLFSRRISNLKVGRGRYAVACTPSGGIFMDGIVFRLESNRFWYVIADGAFDTWMLAHSDGFDVTIKDPQSWVLQIQGPTSPAVLEAASEGQINERLGYFHAGFFDLGGQRLYVSRTGFTGEVGYEIYTQGDETDCPRLWNHLCECGEPHGMVCGSVYSMNARRIEAGILNNGTDMDWNMTPYNAGLGDFVDLEKQNFIGRDALLNTPQEQSLYGLVCKAATPVAGDQVRDENRVVANMRTGVWSPTLEAGIGYVQFEESGDWTGHSVQLVDDQGVSHPADIVQLPFFDAEKRIPRGLTPTSK